MLMSDLSSGMRNSHYIIIGVDMSFVVELTEEMNIAQYLMEHVNEIIPEKVLLKVAPRYGKDIVDMLEMHLIIERTEEGLLYKKSEAKHMGVFLEVIERAILSGTKVFQLNLLLNRIVSLEQANADALAEDSVMRVAEPLSRDIAEEQADLHDAKGANFVRLLKEIASHREFRIVENEDCIFYTGGERGEDFPNLLNAARKAVVHGYRVFILPNPKGIRTADFIFEQKGNYKAYDLKTISGKSSVSNRLFDSIGQSNRVLLNMTADYNARLLASDIKTYFESNLDAVEVMIFKGKKVLSVSRYHTLNPLFNKNFRRKYEK